MGDDQTLKNFFWAVLDTLQITLICASFYGWLMIYAYDLPLNSAHKFKWLHLDRRFRGRLTKKKTFNFVEGRIERAILQDSADKEHH